MPYFRRPGHIYCLQCSYHFCTSEQRDMLRVVVSLLASKMYQRKRIILQEGLIKLSTLLSVYILHCPDNLLLHSTGVITVPHQSCFNITESLNTYIHLYALLYAAVHRDATIVMTYDMSYRIHNSVILIEINCFML